MNNLDKYDDIAIKSWEKVTQEGLANIPNASAYIMGYKRALLDSELAEKKSKQDKSKIIKYKKQKNETVDYVNGNAKNGFTISEWEAYEEGYQVGTKDSDLYHEKLIEQFKLEINNLSSEMYELKKHILMNAKK